MNTPCMVPIPPNHGATLISTAPIMNHIALASTNVMNVYSALIVATSNSFDVLNIANEDVYEDLLARKILESADQTQGYNTRFEGVADASIVLCELAQHLLFPAICLSS